MRPISSKADSNNEKKKVTPIESVKQTTQLKAESEETAKQSGYDFNKLNSDDFDLDEFVG